MAIIGTIGFGQVDGFIDNDFIGDLEVILQLEVAMRKMLVSIGST